MNIRLFGLLIAAVVGISAGGAHAAPPRGAAPVVKPKPRALPTGIARDNRAAIFNQSRRIDINNINMFVTNYGTFANDIENQGNSGLFYPKGTTKTAVYQSGPWLCGKVGNDVRAAVGEYNQEYQPGAMNVPISPGVFGPDDFSKEDYIVYKVVRYTGAASDTDHVERDPGVVSRDRTVDPIAHHSWSEYVNGAGPYGAPVRTYRFPNPAIPGDSVDVLGPDMKGDQMLWCVYNDADPGAHNPEGGLTPMGVEVQQTTFGFDRQGALGNTVFLEFKVINKGGNQIDSCYINMWSDPDLGGAGDDLVGCDTLLSMGYIYNATATDQLYGSRSPAVGYDFFQGPRVGNAFLPLTSFIFYENGRDPGNAGQVFNYMRGFDRDGSPFVDHLGNETKFYASGDPTAKPPTGFLDSNPSDRRFMNVSGPFTLAPGDTQVIVGAIVIAQGNDRLTSITGLKFFDVQAQKAFDLAFDLPPPPPQPRVSFSTDHGRINLLWDSGSRFNYTPDPGYAFEGYNVYQGESVSGPWRRLVTYDLANGIADVRDSVFDIETGLIIADEPVAFGGDAGVVYTYSTGDDAIKGGPLKDGTAYFYAVTAYAVNENPEPGLDKVLENSFQPVTVIPQRPASGTDVGSAKVNASTVSSTAPLPTTDHVIIDVVDPASITGDTYAITYNTVGPDVLWNLINRTTGQTLISNQLERTDNPVYAPVDGMIVKLRESQAADPIEPLNDIYYAPFDNDMPFHGVGAGLHYFEDSFGYASHFFGFGVSEIDQPQLFKNVELRFGPGQKAYRYTRDETSTGGAPAGDRGYPYLGFHDIGLQAWNLDDNVQLEVGFVERRITDNAPLATRVPVGAQPATQDATWNPDGTALGGREYLFISLRPYTGNPAPELAVDNAVGGSPNPAGADTLWLYAGWLLKTGTVKSGDKFVMKVGGNRVGTPADTVLFTSSAATTNVVSLQKDKLSSIRVVPNPYYSRSTYELSPFNRVIKFTNMPEQATVRIYDLAGRLIRTLQKTDANTSILEWDLQNENRLPVASAVYIYHIDVPNAGTTVGRLVIFMEKEQLRNL